MKGIILAGGEGSRLHPVTISVTKQLLPVYDKPMIYYPLCTLMEANIRKILCICTQKELPNFTKLLSDGKQWGIEISFAIQKEPKGIAESFIIGSNFIDKESVALILGDNIFYGIDFEEYLFFDDKVFNGAQIFIYKVPDPQRYGVVEIKDEKVISIEEKPINPKSNFVATGLYFYDNSVKGIAKSIKPSNRNEIEITDINKHYLNQNNLKAKILKQGMVWLDAGTSTSLLQASHYVQTIQERQNIQIGSPEEIALKRSWITKYEFEKIAELSPQNSYGDYLRNILKEL